jgi:hypothetical protein
MYQKMLSIEQVALVPLTLLQPPYPNWYKSDLTRKYHAGILRHSIYIWNAFKKKLLHLIKVGWKEEVDLTKEVNNPVTKDETNEFLKLMKHSEYSVVEQLKKTPARISL